LLPFCVAFTSSPKRSTSKLLSRKMVNQTFGLQVLP
jgi:hypothetical protein